MHANHLGAGQLQGETAAVSGLTVDLQVALHHFQQALAQRQPQASAFDLGIGAQAFEGLEQLVQLFRGNAMTGVVDGDAHLMGLNADFDTHLTAGPVVLDGVGQQVEQHLHQALAVREHAAVVGQRWQLGQVDPGVGGHW
ncbi:hypothetical protein D3C76_1086870 [compost metagenome]